MMNDVNFTLNENQNEKEMIEGYPDLAEENIKLASMAFEIAYEIVMGQNFIIHKN